MLLSVDTRLKNSFSRSFLNTGESSISYFTIVSRLFNSMFS